MPKVLCGLTCFDVSRSATAEEAARELVASFDPTLLDGPCRNVEVFRLERLSPDALLDSEDAIVCQLPGWRFDVAALEDLHRQLEDLRSEHDDLKVQHGRTKEALMALNASVEASEAAEAAQRRAVDGGRRELANAREVLQLRHQLAQSERKQQETKATVMALRSEFMHLVEMMSEAGGLKCKGLELPSVVKDSPSWSPHPAPCDADKLGTTTPVAASRGDSAKPTRLVSQPTRPSAPRGGIQPPRVQTVPPGSGAQSRGVRRGVHSAGATARRGPSGEAI